jgi:NAD(P)H-dependent FMN reductase
MEGAMQGLFKQALDALGRPHVVEFDYRDAVGIHHGRCYVRCLFSSEAQLRHVFTRLGYTNVRIL